MSEPGKDIEGFFSRSHLISAGWTALFGVVSFIGGILWNVYTSPTKVVVTNLPKTVNATSAPVIYPFPENSINALNKLSKELNRYQKELIHFEKQALNASTNRNKQSKYLEKSVGDLTATLNQLTNSAAIRQQTAASNIKLENTKIQHPEFSLPSGVKGYTKMGIYGVTDVRCPQRDVLTSAVLNFGFTLKNDDLLQGITPLFVSIDKIVDATHLTQIYAQQYRINFGKNDYKVTINLNPGDYQFEFGYYMRDQLQKEFPNFYEKDCRVTAVSH